MRRQSNSTKEGDICCSADQLVTITPMPYPVGFLIKALPARSQGSCITQRDQPSTVRMVYI